MCGTICCVQEQKLLWIRWSTSISSDIYMYLGCFSGGGQMKTSSALIFIYMMWQELWYRLLKQCILGLVNDIPKGVLIVDVNFWRITDMTKTLNLGNYGFIKEYVLGWITHFLPLVDLYIPVFFISCINWLPTCVY